MRAEALLAAVGATLASVDRAFRERYLAAVHANTGEAALEEAIAEGRAMTQGQAIEAALSV